MNHAGFMKRFFAFCVDNTVFLFLYGLSIAVIFFALGGSLDPGKGNQLTGALSILISYFVTIVIFAFTESSFQTTLGKKLVGIKVQSSNVFELGLFKAILRNFVKWTFSVPSILGCLLGLMTKNRQALHDLMAQSVVVDDEGFGFGKIMARTFAGSAVLFLMLGACAYYSYQKYAPVIAMATMARAATAPNAVNALNNLSNVDTQSLDESLKKLEESQKKLEALAAEMEKPAESPATCKSGLSCQAMAKGLMQGNRDEGVRTLWKACQMGADASCILLGRIYKRAKQNDYALQATKYPCVHLGRDSKVCDELEKSASQDFENVTADETVWSRLPASQ